MSGIIEKHHTSIKEKSPKVLELIDVLKEQKSIIAELTIDSSVKEIRAKKAFDFIDLAIEELEKN